VTTEPDSNDITKRWYDDKPTIEYTG